MDGQDGDDDPLALRPYDFPSSPNVGRAGTPSHETRATIPSPGGSGSVMAMQESDEEAPVPTSDDEEMLLEEAQDLKGAFGVRRTEIGLLKRRRAEWGARLAEEEDEGRQGSRSNEGLTVVMTPQIAYLPFASLVPTAPTFQTPLLAVHPVQDSLHPEMSGHQANSPDEEINAVVPADGLPRAGLEESPQDKSDEVAIASSRRDPIAASHGSHKPQDQVQESSDTFSDRTGAPVRLGNPDMGGAMELDLEDDTWLLTELPGGKADPGENFRADARMAPKMFATGTPAEKEGASPSYSARGRTRSPRATIEGSLYHLAPRRIPPTTPHSIPRSSGGEPEEVPSMPMVSPVRRVPLFEPRSPSPILHELIRERSASLSPPPPSPLRSTTPPHADDLAPVPIPPQSPSDPLLAAFRSARTFRTRTAIQLQPYTREKKKYTELVRTGGKLLIREMLHDDPDARALARQRAQDAEESQDTPFGVYTEGGPGMGETQAEEEDEEQDVSIIDMAVTPDVDVEDGDYDAYFTRYGEVAESSSDARLQALARRRLKLLEAEVRKQAREEKLARRDQAEAERALQREMQEKRRAERERQRAVMDAKKLEKQARKRARTEGGRGIPARVELRSESEDDRPASSKKRKNTPRPARLDPDDEESPPTRTIARSYQGSAMSNVMSSTPDLDHGHDTEGISSPFSLGGLTDPAVNEKDGMMSVASISEDEAEILGSAIDRGRLTQRLSSLSDPETGPASATPVPKKKVKVLKRVLPAFMIKKLATDQAKKDRAMDRIAADAPVRPAGRPKTGTKGRSDAAEMANWFDDESIVPDGLAGMDPLDGPEDVPVLVAFSSDSEMSLLSLSDDDPLEEDAAESVQMLDRGHFDRLLVGGRGRPGDGERREYQARGADDRTMPRDTRPLPRRLRQTRLPLLVARHRSGHGTGRAKRRIVMDDETIFQRSSAPRQALQPILAPQRTRLRNEGGNAGTGNNKQSRPLPRLAKGSSPAISVAPESPSGDRLGYPEHKAEEQLSAQMEIWSEIKDFQVDFQVKPMASGVSFENTSFVGSGALHLLLQDLRGEPSAMIGRRPRIEIYGLALDSSLTSEELITSLPIIQQGVIMEVERLSAGTSSEAGRQATHALEYLAVISSAVETHGMVQLDVVDTLSHVARALQDARLPHSKPTESDQLLVISRTLMTSLWRLHARADPVLARVNILPLIKKVTEDLMLKLLQHGFNRTMKPLKEVMAFLADTPIIKDVSAECWVILLHLMRFAEHALSGGIDATPLNLQFTMEAALGNFLCNNDRHGPRTSEKLWYLAFGMASLGQFDEHGVTGGGLDSRPLWFLVRRALSAIALPQMSEEDELRKRHHLRTRDLYVKILIVRCLRLNSVWQWHCDKESFQIATKDLGTVFRERHHRNFPSEVSSDFPAFISEYDLSRTEEVDMDDSAYNLYLRLLAVTASDLVGSATTVGEAESMVKEVQRMMLSILPLSAVSLKSGAIPTSRQTSALTNRYSTAVIAGLFVPSLIPWLLNNSSKWVDLASAHVEIRTIVIRGLMYMAIASRHHQVSLKPVVDKLAEAFEVIRADRDRHKEGTPDRSTLSRLLVLIIGSFRHIIQTPSFRKDACPTPAYPDPTLLHPCWTSRLKSTELVTDRRAGNEVIDCIQAFLDARHAAMPDRVKRNRAAKLEDESQNSGFDDFGIDFTDEDILALGGGADAVAPEFAMDQDVADRIARDVSPGLYHLLSNCFSSSETTPSNTIDQSDRQIYISRLTKCWADCASVLVVDHRQRDWSTYLGHGSESWERLGDEQGKKQVGMGFMLNVARLDPNVFCSHPDEFIRLLLQSLVSNLITVEPPYVSAVLAMPGAMEHPILLGLGTEGEEICDRGSFGRWRGRWLRIIFANIAQVLTSPRTERGEKIAIYRSVNSMIAAMHSNFNAISLSKLAQRISYSALCDEIVSDLKQEGGGLLSAAYLHGLDRFPLHRVVGDVGVEGR